MKRAFVIVLLLIVTTLAIYSSPVNKDTYVNLDGKTLFLGIAVAVGAAVTKLSLIKEDKTLNIEECGAHSLERRSEGDRNTYAIKNTEIINMAIDTLSHSGGGTVIIPPGTFRTYTIVLKDNVNIKLEKGAVLEAAKTRIYNPDGSIKKEAEDFFSDGTPGNYLKPECNIYIGLQDNAHSYFQNSLFYGGDKKNIMIYGGGLINGSQLGEDGSIDYVLDGWDPQDPARRSGEINRWFGNKGISLVRCENIVLEGINVLNSGHIAIITEGSSNVLIDSITVDTNRDALDIDCSQNVSVINSRFNSLTDDAIVFKASYGAGIFKSVYNCLVKNCTVSGYDAGSVIAGTYTENKLVATDKDGPTARVKFGTESTCGYNRVTIDGVSFKRSRGFSIEAVDGGDVHDIIFVNAIMEDVSSSPIFIRTGNRGRYPVTGNTTDDTVNQKNNIRLTNTGWIIPQNSRESKYEYTEYPTVSYYPVPSYNLYGAEMSNGVKIPVIDSKSPLKINASNFTEENGKYYLKRWENGSYTTDYSREITEKERALYADAVAYSKPASAYNIAICNITVKNADPRYPIILSGLVDSLLKNITIKDVSVEYRGGLRMIDAVEQKQLSTKWSYTQYMTKPQVQSLPWLVNTFFTKTNALLPRVDWDEEKKGWFDDPYNVPEMAREYPEPSIFGILPAYGMYLRHTENITIENVKLGYIIDDERHAVVLDDCHSVTFNSLDAESKKDVKKVAFISNNYKRRTGFEFVPDYPYISTTNSEISGIDTADILFWTVNAPERGTPSDSLYPYPTVADITKGYYYSTAPWTYNGKDYSLPVTVYRPFFENAVDVTIKSAENLTLTISARNPGVETEGIKNAVLVDESLTYSASHLPPGASFNSETHTLTWPSPEKGEYRVTFTIDDGIIPVEKSIKIIVT